MSTPTPGGAILGYRQLTPDSVMRDWKCPLPPNKKSSKMATVTSASQYWVWVLARAIRQEKRNRKNPKIGRKEGDSSIFSCCDSIERQSQRIHKEATRINKQVQQGIQDTKERHQKSAYAQGSVELTLWKRTYCQKQLQIPYSPHPNSDTFPV